MLLRFLIGRIGWRSFALGAGTALFGGSIVRPVLATAVKTGMEVRDAAAQTYAQAKLDAAGVGASSSPRESGLGEVLADIRTTLSGLRDDIATIKSRGVTKP